MIESNRRAFLATTAFASVPAVLLTCTVAVPATNGSLAQVNAPTSATAGSPIAPLIAAHRAAAEEDAEAQDAHDEIEWGHREGDLTEAIRRHEQTSAARAAAAIAFLEARCTTPAELALKLHHIETDLELKDLGWRPDYIQALARASLGRSTV